MTNPPERSGKQFYRLSFTFKQKNSQFIIIYVFLIFIYQAKILEDYCVVQGMVQSQTSTTLLLAYIFTCVFVECVCVCMCIHTCMHTPYFLVCITMKRGKQKMTMLQMFRGNAYTGKDKVCRAVCLSRNERHPVEH